MLLKNRKSTLISTLIAILLLSFMLASCSSQPAEAPIVDKEWQWVSLKETLPASQSVVPQPENYTLYLGSDGELSIKADCNMVGGSYEMADSSLQIILGPSTMAFCGEDSLDTQYLELLGRVTSYAVEEDHLILKLADDAGEMTFR